MAKSRVMVVEDEQSIAELIEYNLLKEGFAAIVVPNGEDALRSARKESPDLVLLDLMLPGIDGLEVCRSLKRDTATSAIPVLMVTAKGEEADIVTGLELGADDYIVKPFSPKVLLARVKAILRRRTEGSPDDAAPVKRGELELYPGRREVTVGGERVQLTFTEFNILDMLARRPGWVFTRSQIVAKVRGDQYHVTERSTDVHILGLRRKLGSAGRYIETVRGVGYRFQEQE